MKATSPGGTMCFNVMNFRLAFLRKLSDIKIQLYDRSYGCMFQRMEHETLHAAGDISWLGLMIYLAVAGAAVVVLIWPLF